MVGMTLSPEQIRAAPPEVRRWLEHEIAATLGFDLPTHAMRPPEQHLVGTTQDEVRAIQAEIQGLLPVVAVFFELGREGAAVPAPGVRAFRLVDIQRHTRLAAPEPVLAAFAVLNDALRRLRGDAEAVLVAPDANGVVFVAESTSVNVLRLWQEIVAERDLAVPGVMPEPTPADAPLRGPSYHVTLPMGASAAPGTFGGAREAG